MARKSQAPARSLERRYPPQAVDKANGAPEFLTVEKQTTYVIAGGDDTSIALTRAELEQLYQWWKAERKSA